MKTIRYNTFETNSSSAHVLTIIKNSSLYERFLNKEGVFYNIKRDDCSDEFYARHVNEDNFITFAKVKKFIDEFNDFDRFYYKDEVQRMKEMSIDELKNAIDDYDYAEAVKEVLNKHSTHWHHIISDSDLPEVDKLAVGCAVFFGEQEC